MNDESSISFTVQGRPPSKGSSGSPLSASYNRKDRTRALLEAAKKEMERTGFKGFGGGGVKLEVEIRTGPGEPPWDATNILGGIADVLDSKAHKKVTQPTLLVHLEELADVGLYDDDRQIQEVTYRVVDHPKEEYLITVARLDPAK